MRPPDFLIIGAMRAGTTTLHRALSAHPEIGMPREKETDFFIEDRAWRRGAAWYASLFPDRPVLGEASPNYTKRDDFPGVPARAASVCPDAKLIYLVRDPWDRFLSQYRHAVALGTLPPGALTDHEFGHILRSGLYHHQASAWLEHFEKDRLLFVDHAELSAEPDATLGRVQAFLGAAPRPLPTARHNAGGELAGLPPALMRWSRLDAARAVSRSVPAGARDALRRVLAARRRPSSGPPPAPPGGTRARALPAMAEDTEKLRALTGRPFAGWTV